MTSNDSLYRRRSKPTKLEDAHNFQMYFLQFVSDPTILENTYDFLCFCRFTEIFQANQVRGQP